MLFWGSHPIWAPGASTLFQPPLASSTRTRLPALSLTAHDSHGAALLHALLERREIRRLKRVVADNRVEVIACVAVAILERVGVPVLERDGNEHLLCGLVAWPHLAKQHDPYRGGDVEHSSLQDRARMGLSNRLAAETAAGLR